ncbi:MAG: hypothetical protein ACLQFR_25300 [Streptosporangiaceae bacterium]
MGMTAFRQLKERPAAIFWRRRIAALLIGLSVLASASWAVAGTLGRSASAAGPAATRSVQPTLPARSPAPAPSDAGGVLAGTRGSQVAASLPSTGPSAGRAGRAGTTAASATGRHGPRPCAAHDVVLSLFSSQASYTVRQTPAFQVDVVSTASKTCTFDIGARHVLLQISAGPNRIWTSADCAEGEASLVTKLYRGIPTVVPMAWDARRSAPRCPVPGPPAPAGSYTALATDGSLVSNALTFRIG